MGGDATSKSIEENIRSLGINIHPIWNHKLKAPTYLDILDEKNEGIIAISDMKVNFILTNENVYQTFFKEEERKGANPRDIVVLDANFQG